MIAIHIFSTILRRLLSRNSQYNRRAVIGLSVSKIMTITITIVVVVVCCWPLIVAASAKLAKHVPEKKSSSRQTCYFLNLDEQPMLRNTQHLHTLANTIFCVCKHIIICKHIIRPKNHSQLANNSQSNGIQIHWECVAAAAPCTTRCILAACCQRSKSKGLRIGWIPQHVLKLSCLHATPCCWDQLAMSD